MSDDEPMSGWTAGDHWSMAMRHIAWANDEEDVNKAAVAVGLAQVHLVAARMLLDHPPVDVLDAYPAEAGVEPPKDWRNDRA